MKFNGMGSFGNKRIGTTAVSVIPKGSMESINFFRGDLPKSPPTGMSMKKLSSDGEST